MVEVAETAPLPSLANFEPDNLRASAPRPINGEGNETEEEVGEIVVVLAAAVAAAAVAAEIEVGAEGGAEEGDTFKRGDTVVVVLF